MVVGDTRIMMLFKEKEETPIEEVEQIADKERVSFAITQGTPYPFRLVVGYALTSKKIRSFLQPKLEGVARLKGICFVSVDLSKPLSEQGPFDILLHKLSGKEWRQILEDYRLTHPEVTVLDPPGAIQHLHNRQSMLQDVANLNLSNNYGMVGVPRQLVIEEDVSSIPDAVATAGLSFPLVAKPLYVDGSAKSHALSLAYDQYSLENLEPPIVLQEFVNHGGVLFKVYIVGETVKVVRRFSLPNISKHELLKKAGVFHFPRVSCAAASADNADLAPSIAGKMVATFMCLGRDFTISLEESIMCIRDYGFTCDVSALKSVFFLSIAELPPRPLLEKLGRELRRRSGLRLFNLDIIREHGSQNKFYVIDINYFPGYGKMPEYEHIFTDFLLSLVERKHKKCLTIGH